MQHANESGGGVNLTAFMSNSNLNLTSQRPSLGAVNASQQQSHLNTNFAFSTANLSAINEQNKTIHTSISCHELNVKHNHSFINNSMQSAFHFQLAGFIDPDAGRH
jgi:hypothetical protein